jgi:transcriptional regulator with GAF, ATPase, and Fis domain
VRSDLKSLLQAYERQIIVAALRASDGNQRRAARALGLLPTTLHEKMKRLGIRVRRSSEVDGPAEGSGHSSGSSSPAH